MALNVRGATGLRQDSSGLLPAAPSLWLTHLFPEVGAAISQWQRGAYSRSGAGFRREAKLFSGGRDHLLGTPTSAQIPLASRRRQWSLQEGDEPHPWCTDRKREGAQGGHGAASALGQGASACQVGMKYGVGEGSSGQASEAQASQGLRSRDASSPVFPGH